MLELPQCDMSTCEHARPALSLSSHPGGSGGHYELEVIPLSSGIGGSAASFIINGLSSFVTQAEVKSKANSLPGETYTSS